MRQSVKEHEGKKYLRRIGSSVENGAFLTVDVYDVLDAFGVTSQPIGHAIKKLLCPGNRGKGSILSDLYGALAAINRAIDLEERIEAQSQWIWIEKENEELKEKKEKKGNGKKNPNI